MCALFAENKVRFARAEQLCSAAEVLQVLKPQVQVHVPVPNPQVGYKYKYKYLKLTITLQPKYRYHGNHGNAKKIKKTLNFSYSVPQL